MSRVIAFGGRKWPDSPHWEFEARWLGADVHGQWLGVHKGVWQSRPGMGFHAPADQVMLIPYDEWWVATFYGDDAERPFDTYVDITTPATWAGDSVGAIDLDLDVIKGVTGRVWVDDEDEFAEHRVSLGYPDDVIRSAVRSCESVQVRVQGGAEPFDGATARGWLAKMRSMPR